MKENPNNTSSDRKFSNNFNRKFKKKDKTNQTDLSTYVFGKTQPQAIPLEEAVLGALMLDKDAFIQVSSILQVESFYKQGHQSIYKAMLKLFAKSQPIDLLTVTEEVKSAGELEKIGGPYYIVELTNRVASAANIEYHSRIIAQKYIQRRLIKTGTDIIRKSYEDTTDVFDLFDEIDVEMLEIRDSFLKGKVQTNMEIRAELVKDMEKASERDGNITGLPIFGIPHLDQMLNGAEEDDFILVAGRPGMGKSSLGNSAIANCVKHDFPIAFWSMEMTNKKTYARAASGISGVPYSRIIRGKCEPHEWDLVDDAMNKLDASKVIIRNDRVNIHELRSQIISMIRKHGIKALIFDRIGLIKKTRNSLNDFDHVSEISPLLRATANELGIPIIAMSQLSRAVETRGGAKRPMLSDLRNSGALEQDATKVIFCYRPEYYKIFEDEEGNNLVGKGELIVAKNSNGPTDTAFANFSADCMIYKAPKTDKTFNDIDDCASDNTFSNNNIMTDTRTNDDDIPF